MSVQVKAKISGDLLVQISTGEIPVRVQLGDVWQLGRHRLICGNALDESAVDRVLNSQQPGLVWSDPPYGIKIQHKDGRVGGGSRGKQTTLGGKVITVNYEARRYPIIAGDNTIDTAIAALHLYLDRFPKAAHCWWGANHYADGLPPSPCWIVWDKLNGKTCFADCELAWTNQKTAARKFEWRWCGFVKQGIASQEKRMHVKLLRSEASNPAFCAQFSGLREHGIRGKAHSR